MNGADGFSRYHPAVELLFFAAVLGFTMFVLNPICEVISLAAGLLYLSELGGARAVRRSLPWLALTALATALINAAFNHQGVTILAYLPSGNPLTAESVYYGLTAAVMLVSAIVWFDCFTRVFTSDKFLYLFGRVLPALSLLLSMTLRFVPRFARRFKSVYDGQRAMGRSLSAGSFSSRVRCGGAVLSAAVTWALESSIDVSDSMRSRGYGLAGRSSFSIFKMGERDRKLAVWLAFCCVLLICTGSSGAFYWRFYPSVKWAELTPLGAAAMAVFAAVALTPSAIDVLEGKKWMRSSSKT